MRRKRQVDALVYNQRHSFFQNRNGQNKLALSQGTRLHTLLNKEATRKRLSTERESCEKVRVCDYYFTLCSLYILAINFIVVPSHTNSHGKSIFAYLYLRFIIQQLFKIFVFRFVIIIINSPFSIAFINKLCEKNVQTMCY